jgi:hypothetical protein
MRSASAKNILKSNGFTKFTMVVAGVLYRENCKRIKTEKPNI